MNILDRFALWIIRWPKADKDAFRKRREQQKTPKKFSQCAWQGKPDPEIEELRKLQEMPKECESELGPLDRLPKKCMVSIGNNAHLDSLGYHGTFDSINALKLGWSIRVYFEVDKTTGGIVSAKAVPFKEH